MCVFISTLNYLIELPPIFNFVLDILVCCYRYAKKDLKVKISDQMINDGAGFSKEKSRDISLKFLCTQENNENAIIVIYISTYIRNTPCIKSIYPS